MDEELFNYDWEHDVFHGPSWEQSEECDLKWWAEAETERQKNRMEASIRESQQKALTAEEAWKFLEDSQLWESQRSPLVEEKGSTRRSALRKNTNREPPRYRSRSPVRDTTPTIGRPTNPDFETPSKRGKGKVRA